MESVIINLISLSVKSRDQPLRWIMQMDARTIMMTATRMMERGTFLFPRPSLRRMGAEHPSV